MTITKPDALFPKMPAMPTGVPFRLDSSEDLAQLERELTKSLPTKQRHIRIRRRLAKKLRAELRSAQMASKSRS